MDGASPSGTSRGVSFAGSPGKRRHGLIISGLLAVVGIVAMISSIADGMMIGAAALAMAALFALHVLRTTGGADAVITIDGDGVWFRDWDLPKVPWRHIGGIHVAGIRLRLLIHMDLIDGEAFFAAIDKPPTNPLVRPARLIAPGGAFDAPIGDVVVALREAQENAPR